MTQADFEDLGISKDVLKAVRSAGWTEPTPVQAAAVPIGLEGVDLLAQAQTGTGKTGTFGSIILSRTKSGSSDPTSLVLVPTRELASQVSEELEKLSAFSGHVCIPIYGGVNIESQAKQLKKGADVVVATPGRLKDLIERRVIKLDSITIVVLDEADRMLDMGFAPSVNMILSKLPKDRQTMMFSATMPDEVKKLAVRHMVDHQEVLVSKDEPTLDLTEQFYIMTNRDSKRDELMHLIENDYPKMMVFCRTKRKVDYLTRKLKRDEYDVDGIHGDIGQNKRERIIKEFSQGELQVLIASDVASRGLDIDGVDMVVNYDIPIDPETYIHRIGRTGRAGKTGKAITFVTADDVKGLKALEKAVGKDIAEIPPTSELYTEEPITEDDEPAAKPQRQTRQRANNAKKGESEDRPQRKQRESRKTGDEAQDRQRHERRSREPKEEPADSDESQPVRKERTLHGKLDRKPRKEQRTENEGEGPVRGQRKQRESRKTGDEIQETQRHERKPRENSEETTAKEKPVQVKQDQQGGPKMQYVPQGVPKNPHPLHSYVGIVRAARPKKETSFDRLELNVGSEDGLDVDRLKKFVIRTAGVKEDEIGNLHVSENKSRVQVRRYRSQEVVDELFGQVINGKRVLVYNLSDKQ